MEKEAYEEEFYPYGPIMDKDGNEITLYLCLATLTAEEMEKLDDGDDEFLLLCGGQVQAFYVEEDYIDHITCWFADTKEEKEIPYEQYIAMVNGESFKHVDFFKKREQLPENVCAALDDAIGTESWDGAIYRGEEYEYAAVVKDDKYFATYSITIQAKKV